ncbi:MAG: enoyl-CoA hydratase-related protein, partial [Hyphomicrobiales bacterium]
SSNFSDSPVIRFLRTLATCKIPMIAGVDGLAIGVGTTMLMHCDMVFATTRTTLKTPFLNLGLVPEAGSSLIAPRIMGQQRAFEMLVMGEIFSADAAYRAGLVNHVVDESSLEERVMEAANKLAALPPEALHLSRGLLRGDEDEILQRIDEEAVLFAQRLKSDEAREAFTAFMEKRPPNFTKSSA